MTAATATAERTANATETPPAGGVKPGMSLASLETRDTKSIKAIVPSNMEEVWRLAKAIALAGWAPKSYKVNGAFSEEMIAIGIMHGMEVGFTPIAALQSIAVINGMPSIYGDGALALVLNSGLLQDFKETAVKNDAGRVVGYHFWAIRRGRATPIEQAFMLADAERAHLIGKAGPWTEYEPRMFQMRTRAWGLRDGFADVLKGLHIAEEVWDIPVTNGTGTPAAPNVPKAPPPPPAAVAWPDDQFKEALPRWTKLMTDRKKTPDDIIDMAQLKFPLSDDQKKIIRAVLQPAEQTKPDVRAIAAQAQEQNQPASPEQILQIRKKAEDRAINTADIFRRFKIDSLDGIPASLVNPILAFIDYPVFPAN